MTRRFRSAVLAAPVIALLGLVAMVGLASPASAHSVSGVGATNWHTTLTSVTPTLPGVSLQVVENGSRLELTNHGPEVEVFGYDGEPYLRVGPLGVFVNTLSPAAYLNCSRNGCPVPPYASSKAPPRWEKISTGQTILWHDHRTHWMGRQLPPDVTRDPGARHVQAHWTVSMAQGRTAITATGYYTWVPGPGAFPWLVVVLILAGVGIVVAVSKSWRVLAVATGVVVGVDFGHAAVVAGFWAGNTVFRIAELFDGSSYQIPGWILGLVAVRLLWRHAPRGRQAALWAGASAVVFTGLLDFAVLNHSAAPFAGSIALDRVCVALCLGLGLAVVVGALALLRADRIRVEYSDADSDSDVDSAAESDSDSDGEVPDPKGPVLDAVLGQAFEDHGHALASAHTHRLEADMAVVERQ